MTETIEAIVTFFVVNWKWIMTTITTIIGFVSALLKAIQYKDLNILKDKISIYISNAENLNIDGNTKLEIVLTKARLACMELGLKYDEIRVKSIIEGLIDFSKNVNKREKDKLLLIKDDEEF